MKDPRPTIKVGDIVSLPDDFDPALAKIAIAQRATFRRARESAGGNQSVRAARVAIAASERAQDRLRDPVEQAKTYLRSKGYIPVATLDGIHTVGRHRFSDDAQLFKFAAEKGWGKAL